MILSDYVSKRRLDLGMREVFVSATPRSADNWVPVLVVRQEDVTTAHRCPLCGKTYIDPQLCRCDSYGADRFAHTEPVGVFTL